MTQLHGCIKDCTKLSRYGSLPKSEPTKPKPEPKAEPIVTIPIEELIQKLNQLSIELTALNAEIKT